METLGVCVVLGIVVGLLIGIFGGVVIHEYELNKCNSLSSSTNQEYYNYELQNDCYFVLEKTEWHFFLAIFAFGIIGALLFGAAGMFLGDYLSYC